jgi:streptogramin lyase
MAFRMFRVPAPAGPRAFTAFAELSGVDPVTGRTTMHLAVVAVGSGCVPPGPPDPSIQLRVDDGAASTLVSGQPVPVEGPAGTAGLATLSGSGVLLVEVEVLDSGNAWQLRVGGPSGGTVVVADRADQVRQAWIDAPAELTFETEVGGTGTRTLNVANHGTGPLRIENPTGPLGRGFELADVAPRVVEPNTCAAARITFRAPAEPGQVAGSLKLTGNDPNPAAEPGHNSAVALLAAVRRPLWAPGDVLVTDVDANATSGLIFRFSPATGQSVLSAAGLLVSPQGMAFEPDGNLLVANSGPDGTTGSVLRIDRFTGAQSVLTAGAGFSPAGVAVAPDGTVFVADAGPFGESGSVFEVDPRTGERTVIATGGLLQTPCDLVLQGDAILVLRGDAFGGAGGVVRVDAAGGLSLLSGGGLFTNPSMRPQAIAAEPAGTLLVAETHGLGGGVIRINPVNGAQQKLDGLVKARPVGIATTAGGRILITSEKGPQGQLVRGIVELDRVNGQPTVISQDGLFGDPRRLAVAP